MNIITADEASLMKLTILELSFLNLKSARTFFYSSSYDDPAETSRTNVWLIVGIAGRQYVIMIERYWLTLQTRYFSDTVRLVTWAPIFVVSYKDCMVTKRRHAYRSESLSVVQRFEMLRSAF